MTVILIVAILAVLLFPAFTAVRSRTEKVQSLANLHSLYTGAEAYLQQNGKWPQIDTRLIKTRDYDKAWIAALEPFSISRQSWICPTAQKAMGSPDYTRDEFVRIDYAAMPFDSKTMTPHRWSTQPWFIERGNMHGRGNLIIFTDGHIAELEDYAKQRGSPAK